MLTMRITGGKYCGRKVIIPTGELEIRPAMDRMRESLFAILGPLDGASFCDLFSGSGCVGLEAASRGATLVHLVEMDKAKRPTMEKNISWATAECDIKIFNSNVLKFIPTAQMQYDIVYADPPFPMGNKIQLAELTDRRHAVKPDGLFIIHFPAPEENQWPEQIGDLKLVDTRKYGRNMLKFYRNMSECALGQ
ncbi:MAG: 16S rRNA (guanine(966)-N(2))-methyltransferase RsmD [Sphaerochaetaceae bacterium]|nr:16S rRNA (guanine(966)-N(2))-methyltransferase RsmD [Sphaerochaetaceae bacterium]